MKHTLIIGATALALSACTCTYPETQYTVQPANNTVQYEAPKSSPMMVNFGAPSESANIEYRRYTQIKYTQPQQPEVVYYPVYQPVMVQPQYRTTCYCQQYSSYCGC